MYVYMYTYTHIMCIYIYMYGGFLKSGGIPSSHPGSPAQAGHPGGPGGILGAGTLPTDTYHVGPTVL